MLGIFSSQTGHQTIKHSKEIEMENRDWGLRVRFAALAAFGSKGLKLKQHLRGGLPPPEYRYLIGEEEYSLDDWWMTQGMPQKYRTASLEQSHSIRE
jgi:hypothetical protein